jgi:RNA-binding protein
MNDAAKPVPRLPGKTLRDLRARAHSLKPVVWVAEGGATAGVLREIDRALNAHELIKIRAALEGRTARDEMLASICAELGAQPVQVIGKMLVAFRPRPAAPEPEPAAPRRTRSAAQRGKAPPTPKRSVNRSKRKPAR